MKPKRAHRYAFGDCRAAILSRKAYVERIHACYRLQGMGMATHDVLMHHDAALRAALAAARPAPKTKPDVYTAGRPPR
jgi:hypothetical protein